MKKFCHNDCIDIISLQYVFSDSLCDDYSRKKTCHKFCIDRASPTVCVLKCIVSWPLCVKSLSQWLHWYDFFFNVYPQVTSKTILWEGLVTLSSLMWFSPVCVLRWLLKLLLLEKALSQWLHWCRFSPLCDLGRIIRFCFFGKSILQYGYIFMAFPQSVSSGDL